jgi:hypothetical protein
LTIRYPHFWFRDKIPEHPVSQVRDWINGTLLMTWCELYSCRKSTFLSQKASSESWLCLFIAMGVGAIAFPFLGSVSLCMKRGDTCLIQLTVLL